MKFEVSADKNARKKFFTFFNENYRNIESGILGKSILGSEIHYYKIGNGKKQIVSVGAHHGMEHITAAALFGVILKIAENLTRCGTSYDINIAFLLQKFTFWFVPCLNPDGVDFVISGIFQNPLYDRQLKMNGGRDFSFWQANARGVDLNHNYDYRFSEYKGLEAENNILPGRTRFSGEYPESEPETKALLNLIRTVRPKLIISFHSAGEEVFFRPRSSKKSRRIASACADILSYKLSVPEGLSDFGGLSDYTGEVLGITSLTVEVGKGENPLQSSQLGAITERIYKLFCLLPTHL